MHEVDVAIIGAGPYGLSLAAHLKQTPGRRTSSVRHAHEFLAQFHAAGHGA